MIQIVRDLAATKTLKVVALGAAGVVEEYLRGGLTIHQSIAALLAGLVSLTLRHAIAQGGKSGSLAALAAEVAARIRTGDDPQHDQALEVLERGFIEAARKEYAKKGSTDPGKVPPIA